MHRALINRFREMERKIENSKMPQRDQVRRLPVVRLWTCRPSQLRSCVQRGLALVHQSALVLASCQRILAGGELVFWC